MMKLKRAYEMFTRCLGLLPYGISADKEVWCNARSAKNTIALWRDLHGETPPKTLIDVGANNSQWAEWVIREWAAIKVISVEPHPAFMPTGKVYRTALATVSGEAHMTTERGASHIDIDGDVKVPMRRGDALFTRSEINIYSPVLLKVDCENFTVDALAGFGDLLPLFDVIVVEMWNHMPQLHQFRYQQADIWNLMMMAGKRGCRMVDAEWTAGDGIPHYDAAFYAP